MAEFLIQLSPIFCCSSLLRGNKNTFRGHWRKNLKSNQTFSKLQSNWLKWVFRGNSRCVFARAVLSQQQLQQQQQQQQQQQRCCVYPEASYICLAYTQDKEAFLFCPKCYNLILVAKKIVAGAWIGTHGLRTMVSMSICLTFRDKGTQRARNSSYKAH